MKKYLLLWLFLVFVIVPIVLEAAGANKTETYKKNIRKIEDKLLEIEHHALIFGLAYTSEKYPRYFIKSMRDVYYIHRGDFFENGHMFKYEPVECGEIKKNKYIKINIWKKHWEFNDLASKAKEFEDYELFGVQYLICSNDYGEVIETYDSLETYKTKEILKTLVENCSNVAFYSLFSNNHVFIRNLNRHEINLLIESIKGIRYNVYNKSYDPNGVMSGLIRYSNMGLHIECNNSNYEIFIKETDRAREIAFKDFNIIAHYKYDDEIFFKLMLELLTFHNISYHDIFYPDNYDGLGYPDYLFRTLSPETQELMCRSKRSIYSSVGESDCLKTDSTLEITAKHKTALEEYIKRANEDNEFTRPWRGAHILLPHCPSNYNKKYSYLFETGSVEIKCPIHGKLKMPLK